MFVGIKEKKKRVLHEDGLEVLALSLLICMLLGVILVAPNLLFYKFRVCPACLWHQNNAYQSLTSYF